MNNPNLTSNDNRVVSNPLIVESDYQPITIADLVELLKTINKATFVRLITRTQPKMNKKDENKNPNPYLSVIKETTANYLIGVPYETLVNNRMFKEGMEKDFLANACSVGSHISPCLLFNAELNRYYLQFTPFDNSVHSVEYFHNGSKIDVELLKPFFPPENKTSRQPQDKKIVSRSVKLENIYSIHINGLRYKVIL